MRGWLLVLCVVLTVINPLFGLCYAKMEYPITYWRFPQSFVGLWLLRHFETVGLVSFQVLSLFAGIQLWRVKHGAIRFAKIYLVAYLSFALICAIGPFLVTLPLQMQDDRLHPFLLIVLPATSYFLMVFSYLSKSQRVKATFCPAGGARAQGVDSGQAGQRSLVSCTK